MSVVKVGDTVMWRGAFGGDPARPAVVMGMEVTNGPREKDGRDVEVASWSLVRENRVVFILDTGNWAYSDQIQQPRRGIS
jgi:hypothetical protein